MAISIDWPTGVIFVPKADTVLAGTDPISGREIRSFDTDQFHEDLRDEEETVAGRAWPLTHSYNAAVVIDGVAYAPQLTMVNNYQVEFESVGTPWRVIFTSTNNNIASFSVVNDVSIQPGNSAGLQIVTSGSGVTAQDKTDIINGVWTKALESGLTAEEITRIMLAAVAGKTAGVGTTNEHYKSVDGGKDRIDATFDAENNRTVVVLDGA